MSVPKYYYKASEHSYVRINIETSEGYIEVYEVIGGSSLH